MLAATKFIAHLVNQMVVHELLALEVLKVLLVNSTDDSVEVQFSYKYIIVTMLTTYLCHVLYFLNYVYMFHVWQVAVGVVKECGAMLQLLSPQQLQGKKHIKDN